MLVRSLVGWPCCCQVAVRLGTLVGVAKQFGRVSQSAIGVGVASLYFRQSWGFQCLGADQTCIPCHSQLSMEVDMVRRAMVGYCAS
jgi:hypothetical protein